MNKKREIERYFEICNGWLLHKAIKWTRCNAGFIDECDILAYSFVCFDTEFHLHWETRIFIWSLESIISCLLNLIRWLNHLISCLIGCTFIFPVTEYLLNRFSRPFRILNFRNWVKIIDSPWIVIYIAVAVRIAIAVLVTVEISKRRITAGAKEFLQIWVLSIDYNRFIQLIQWCELLSISSSLNWLLSPISIRFFKFFFFLKNDHFFPIILLFFADWEIASALWRLLISLYCYILYSFLSCIICLSSS